MSRVFLDTNILIYFLEDSGPRGQRAAQIFSSLSNRGDILLISSMTVGETLVKPKQLGNQFLEAKYRSLFDSPDAQVLPFDRKAGEIFATVRQNRSIKAPDAIQLATAASAQCDLFITNDDRLSKIIVPGIQFIVPMDRTPF
ncbi:MAG TPA: PIN domain-containing protein [Acidobacteriaceae bacterium]|nr:PIN domain-containing protein [Acidobacteriaceae bacterium]